MAIFTKLTPISILALMIFNFNAFVQSASSSNYFPSPYPSGVRAVYWPSSNEFQPSATNTNYFTHIIYAFLAPDPVTYKLTVTKEDQKNLPKFIAGLKTRYPPVKTLLSIGGGGSNATIFATMASSKQTRQSFIGSTIQVAQKYGFDGVDLDWEFPDTVEDMANLGLLYQEWHEAIIVEAKTHRKPRLLLTSAVYYASSITLWGTDKPRFYPAEAIRNYLDWVSPMCFDYHGTWDNFTGVNSALYDPSSNISTYYGLRSWIKAGVPPGKLVMGLPMYGRAWKLEDPNVHGLGAPAVGPATNTDGTLDYDEIMKFNEKNGASVVFDNVSVSYYSYAGSTWITYDDVGSIGKKVQYARLLGLRGYFFWALGKDKDWALSRQGTLPNIGQKI